MPGRVAPCVRRGGLPSVFLFWFLFWPCVDDERLGKEGCVGGCDRGWTFFSLRGIPKCVPSNGTCFR